ncbi:hypothetical protein EW146_g5239 [Bondarzewia mesenterica]|uniref:AB hydrolase-1 domain-containing protein n=1 Tax=Bondarzewia mesenterica TaxID=1095465 RepID=A0A4S4LS70_9AGAM|nr:hypothetical protein EW146_g5239 [Bondarzewia mesenterica]
MPPQSSPNDTPSEQSHRQQPRRDLSFYAVLFFAVLPVWSVPPLSWAFVLYSLHTGAIWTYSRSQTAWFALALAEVFFSIYHLNLAFFVKRPCTMSAGNPAELQAAFNRVTQAGLAPLPEEGFDEETLDVSRPGSPAEVVERLDHHDPRAIDFRNSLRTWFRKAPWSHIHKQEMYQWLYWSIFNAHLPSLNTLTAARRQILDEVLELVEKRAGASIPDGTNPSVRPLLLTLDPVNVAWRPLVWYALISLGNHTLKLWYIHRWEMRHGVKDGIEYLLRVPRGYDFATGPDPVVFVHGLGLGLVQYKLILSRLLHLLGDRPILFPLQPHISQQVFHPGFLLPKGRKETAAAMRALLVELGWVRDEGEKEVSVDLDVLRARKGRVTLLSHSNGSFVHAWMLKAHPELYNRSCFVDPVTFCSWEGDVCYNFIYRPCTTGIHLVMRYFVSTELGVANLLQRNFDWSSNSLWYEEIPNARDPYRTKFFLGGNDIILNAERVKRYLTSHGVRKGLFYDPEGRHGQAFWAEGEGYKELVRWLTEPDHPSS